MDAAARWAQMQALFHEALDRPESDRRAYLEIACGGDAALVTDVLALVAGDAAGNTLLDGNLAEAARDVFDGPPPPIETVGPYRVLSVLGQGGMGVVYLARREDLDSLAAVKVLRDASLSPARYERFMREQKVLAQLNHPSIARLYDADTLPDGTPYFVMEYVRGDTLTAYCKAHACAVPERLRLFRAVCEAVQYAHRQAVIHRDLKPSNILVAEDGPGGGPAVKLLDFGIAKQLEDLDVPSAQTQTELRMMTPAYAAPEQIEGGPVGVNFDVYALGVVLYELLTEVPPFDLSGLTPGGVEAVIKEQDPAKPSARVGAAGADRLPAPGRRAWADLDVLCLTAMHKDPQRRYPTVEALMRDLDHYLDGEPLEARPDSLGYRTGKFLWRNRTPVVATTLVTLALVGLVAFYTIRLAAARDDALAEAARTQRVQAFLLNLFEGGDELAGPADSLRVVTLIDRGLQEARVLDSEPEIQAEAYETLGSVYQRLGDLDRADSLLQWAYDQRRAIYGSDHPEVAASLIALGLLRVDQAELEAAERLIREGLAMSRRHQLPEHPDVATALTALGKVLYEGGEYARAIEVLDEAVQLGEALGPAGPEWSTSLTELANVHFYAGNYAVSDSLNRLALALDRERYGDRHPAVADGLMNLGAIQFQWGDYEEAERFFREAESMYRDFYGVDHYETASNWMMLGQALTFQERYDEAMEFLRPALAVREKVFGPTHPRVATTLNEVGTVALKQGDYDTAESHFIRMEEIYGDAYGDAHWTVSLARSNQGSVYLETGDYEEAEALFRDAVRGYTEAQGAEHMSTGIARIKLGRALFRLRRYAEAEEHLLAGYEILSGQTSPSVSWLKAAREDLVALYDALNRPDEAERFQIAGEEK